MSKGSKLKGATQGWMRALPCYAGAQWSPSWMGIRALRQAVSARPWWQWHWLMKFASAQHLPVRKGIGTAFTQLLLHTSQRPDTSTFPLEGAVSAGSFCFLFPGFALNWPCSFLSLLLSLRVSWTAWKVAVQYGMELGASFTPKYLSSRSLCPTFCSLLLLAFFVLVTSNIVYMICSCTFSRSS